MDEKLQENGYKDTFIFSGKCSKAKEYAKFLRTNGFYATVKTYSLGYGFYNTVIWVKPKNDTRTNPVELLKTLKD